MDHVPRECNPKGSWRHAPVPPAFPSYRHGPLARPHPLFEEDRPYAKATSSLERSLAVRLSSHQRSRFTRASSARPGSLSSASRSIGGTARITPRPLHHRMIAPVRGLGDRPKAAVRRLSRRGHQKVGEMPAVKGDIDTTPHRPTLSRWPLCRICASAFSRQALSRCPWLD